MISNKSNLNKHYKVCKLKKKEIIKDKIIKELKKENEELKEVEKDFIQLMKNYVEVLKNSNGNTINNINNDNRQYNMFYVINNYKDAHNIEDLINKPLTDIEKQYILENGSTLGCYYILKSRCIDDIDIDKRPFHCIDTSRCKYLLRSKNDWDVDQNGETIITLGCNKIKDAYDIEDISDIEQYGKNMQQLLKLETKGKTKVLKELSKKTLLKNNIKNTE